MVIKKNVFVVFTEYQFLQSINIATGFYNSENYNNVVYIVRNGRRLMGIDSKNTLTLDNLQVVILDSETPMEIATQILNEKPDHFFFFQGGAALNVYLGYTLSKRGTEISLGPDGYSSFNHYKKKHEFLSFLKDSFNQNLFLIRKNLFIGKLYPFFNYRYGSHKFIDNIWLTHPDQYVHKAKNKVTKLKLPDFNSKCIAFIKHSFNFTGSFSTHDVIYYFNQPLWTDELIETEFRFLKGVLDHFKEHTIILKLHPLTSKKTKLRYQQLNKIRILESTVPAEVLLIRLRNCIVFTGWSSVLMTENKNCNYYFNYPIFKECTTKVLNESNLVILKHINLVSTPQEMKFPQ